MSNFSGIWTIREQGVALKGGIWNPVTFTAVSSYNDKYGVGPSNNTGNNATGVDTVSKTYTSVNAPRVSGKRYWIVSTGFRMTGGGTSNTTIGVTVGGDSLTEQNEVYSQYNASSQYSGFSDASGSVAIVQDIVGSSATGGDGPIFACYFDNVNAVSITEIDFSTTSSSSISSRYMTSDGASDGTVPSIADGGLAHFGCISLNTSNSSSPIFSNTTGWTSAHISDTGTNEYSAILYQYQIGSNLSTVVPAVSTVSPASDGYGYCFLKYRFT